MVFGTVCSNCATYRARRPPPDLVAADLLLDLLDAALQAEDLLLQARLLALERGHLLPACWSGGG